MRSAQLSRVKWIFWGLVLASLIILTIPSIELLETFRSYWRLVGDYDKSPLRQTTTVSISLSSLDRDRKDEQGPDLSFIEFQLSAPRAKSVRLMGDFTRWESGSLKMSKRSDGIWEVLVPLPPGRFHYQFLVDDKAVPDPRNKRSSELRGRKTSVRNVP